MNPFLIYPVPSELPPKPRRLYARLDDLENLSTTQSEFLLGGVDADWFDASRSLVAGVQGPSRLEGVEKMPVFFLEFQSDPPQDPGQPLSWNGKYFFKTEEWVEIALEEGGTSRLYRNLYADPEPVTILNMLLVSSSTDDDLNAAHDLEEWEVSDGDLIAYLAARAKPSIENLAVYDVGQGSAIGLSDAFKKPIIYFDFGGGVRSHVGTRPHSVPDLCICSNPLMMLSHWDSDHWSSGPLVKASLALDWIAPFQSITSPHLAFAGDIRRAGGMLLVSKAGPGTSFSIGNVQLHRATGSSRNDGGFWLKVDPPSSGEPFFFPGDADYQYISSPPSPAAGMAATHHGADWGSKISPPSAGGGGATRVVFSFGIFSATRRNTYGHPTSRSITDHTAAGFSQLDTPLRAGGHSGNGTGHVHLDWAGSPVPTAPCGRTGCYQNLDQS
jgi:hypothetical protein